MIAYDAYDDSDDICFMLHFHYCLLLINVTFSGLFLRVTLLALGNFYDDPNASEVTLKIWVYKYKSATQHKMCVQFLEAMYSTTTVFLPNLCCQ